MTAFAQFFDPGTGLDPWPLPVQSAGWTRSAIPASIVGLAVPIGADKECANVGDIVTFYLKYRNTGGQPITNVAVSDNLTQRLEYVPGSAKTDRDALFTTQPNEVGSTILRWEFTAPLPPREHGLISFQVRVR